MYSSFELKKQTCAACHNQLLKSIGMIQGIFGAEVNSIERTITVQHTEEISTEELRKKLILMNLIESSFDDNFKDGEPSEWGCAL